MRYKIVYDAPLTSEPHEIGMIHHLIGIGIGNGYRFKIASAYRVRVVEDGTTCVTSFLHIRDGSSRWTERGPSKQKKKHGNESLGGVVAMHETQGINRKDPPPTIPESAAR